jgi:hypothetical protein
MAQSSQDRAVANYRRRLREHGMSRYEVRGLDRDKELVRDVARQLSAGDAAAAELRKELVRRIGWVDPAPGSILAALRRSPLVGADLQIERAVEHGRDVDL